MKYKVLLFDADNTLFDFDACEKRALKLVFERHGILLDAQMNACFHSINNDLWSRYESGELSRDEVVFTRFGILFDRFHLDHDGVQFERAYQRELANGHQLLPDAFSLISQLRKDFRLFLVSNGVVETQYKRLHDSGLYPFFKHIFLSEEVGYRKPQPEFFTPVLQAALPSSKEELLLIGDSLSSDIAGANRIGLDCVWMNRHQAAYRGELRIDHEITKLSELLKIIYQDG